MAVTVPGTVGPYFRRWVARLPAYRLRATVAYQDDLREKGRLDRVALGRLAHMRSRLRELEG